MIIASGMAFQLGIHFTYRDEHKIALESDVKQGRFDSRLDLDLYSKVT